LPKLQAASGGAKGGDDDLRRIGDVTLFKRAVRRHRQQGSIMLRPVAMLPDKRRTLAN
jgi:hypothetical protein